MPKARGIGLGSKMMDICLQKATNFGFEKCYLETLPYMEEARKLYRKAGSTDSPVTPAVTYEQKPDAGPHK